MRHLVILIALLLATTAQAATVTAQAGGNWSAAGTWVGGTPPGNGDTADLASYTVVMDITTIPASGTLTAITASSSGKLTVDLSVLGTSAINASNITAGTVNTDGIISVTGAAPAATLTVTGNLSGGTGVSSCGLKTDTSAAIVVVGNLTGGSGSGASKEGLSSSGTGNITITGNLLGGSASSSRGLYSTGAQTITITGNITGGSGIYANGLYLGPSPTCVLNSCNIINSSTGYAIQGYPANITWNNPTNANYIEWANTGRSNKWVTQMLVTDVRLGVIEGDLTGTLAGGPVRIK